MDIEAEVAEAALRLIIQAEEWADFNGSSAVNSLSYDGLISSLTTNVSDNAGAALSATGTTIPAFDKMIKRVRLQGGNKLDAIYLSFGLQTVVNQIVSPQARYFINIDAAAQNLTAGDHVVQYASPIGSIPVIGDFFCKRLQHVSVMIHENLAISGELFHVKRKTIPTEVNSKEFDPLTTTRRESFIFMKDYDIV